MMRRLLRLSLVVLVLGGIGAALAWNWFQQELKRPLLVDEQGLVVQFKSGQSLRDFADQLATKGLLQRPWLITTEARLSGQGRLLKAGEYRIVPGTDIHGLLALLVAGKSLEYSLTLIEGWNLAQVMQALRDNSHISHTLGDLDAEQTAKTLGLDQPHAEGLFFPDTYSFPRGTTDAQMLRRANARMREVLAELWPGRAKGLPYKTPYEALIMASIIEKETGAAHERSDIAGVFVRRLRKGMRLQTDPTVIYGMGKRYKGNIRRKDLREATPYNTYVIQGLPPTPIAIPGRAAIEAALHPADGKALYFVSRGDGTHVFSATLEQHNKAVRKYQLKK